VHQRAHNARARGSTGHRQRLSGLPAALRAVLAHNAAGRRAIRRVLCPGLATTTGRMPAGRCAAQMRADGRKPPANLNCPSADPEDVKTALKAARKKSEGLGPR
jgi:hypothetical protein